MHHEKKNFQFVRWIGWWSTNSPIQLDEHMFEKRRKTTSVESGPVERNIGEVSGMITTLRAELHDEAKMTVGNHTLLSWIVRQAAWARVRFHPMQRRSDNYFRKSGTAHRGTVLEFGEQCLVVVHLNEGATNMFRASNQACVDRYN